MMTSNVVENGSVRAVPANQADLLYLGPTLESCQPSASLDTTESQAFRGSHNLVVSTNCSMDTNTIYHTIPVLTRIPDPSHLSYDNSVALVQDSSAFRGNLQDNMVLDPPWQQAMPAHNVYSRLGGYSAVMEDSGAVNLNSNFILSVPPTTPIDAMGHYANFFPIQNGSQTVDFSKPFINGGSGFQLMNADGRQMLNGRPTERNDRSRMCRLLPTEVRCPKPVFSYSCLIAMALKNSEHGALPVSDIYKYMQENFPFFRTAPDGWKNSVRHNLSLNKAFQKKFRNEGSNSQRKGCLWTLKPEKQRSIEREIRKWFKKHPEAIRRSMSNPENFGHYFAARNDDSDETTPPCSVISPQHTAADVTDRTKCVNVQPDQNLNQMALSSAFDQIYIDSINNSILKNGLMNGAYEALPDMSFSGGGWSTINYNSHENYGPESDLPPQLRTLIDSTNTDLEIPPLNENDLHSL